VGECFFWYRPTRVVPDIRPSNGCCVVVVVVVSNIHPDFTGYGISAMTKKLSTAIYRAGRPFGGVGFLWRKSLADQIAR